MKTHFLKIVFLCLFSILSLQQVSADISKPVGTGIEYATRNAAFDAINAFTIKAGAITTQIRGSFTECFGSTQSHFSAQTITTKPMNLPAVACPAIGIPSREEITAYLKKNRL